MIKGLNFYKNNVREIGKKLKDTTYHKNILKTKKAYLIAQAFNLNQIRIIYTKKRDYKKSLKYFEKTFKTTTKIINYHIKTKNSELANLFKDLKDIAKKNQLNSNVNYIINIIYRICFIRLGVDNFNKKNPTKALKYFEKALEYNKIYTDIPNHFHISDLSNAIGTIYFNQNKKISALKHFKKGLKKAKNFYKDKPNSSRIFDLKMKKESAENFTDKKLNITILLNSIKTYI
jgi:tetratricopeptide (TPR) repeat protein